MVYFVATPIGNLGDISYRAVETLGNADIVFCEDTRRSAVLMNRYGIKKPLRTLHKFNEASASARLIEEAKSGKEIAVISDAGMPGVSDPGQTLAAALTKENIPYTVIPGACAFLSALVLSAFPSDRFMFLGFLPDRAGERERLLEKYRDLDVTLCIHSAPQDVDRDISSLHAVFGDRRACAVREITKIHEERAFFALSEGLPGEKRGEYVLVIEGRDTRDNPLCALSGRDHILHYMNEGMDKKEAVKAAARDRGVPKSEMYRFALDL